MSDATPAEAEASDIQTMDVDYEGTTYKVPASPEDWDIEVQRLFQADRRVDAYEALLGETQFAAFYKKHRTNRHLNAFAEVLSIRYGFKSAGESKASSST